MTTLPQSWALAAISDEDRAALYGLYAVLYGSPLLLRGLEWNDPWAITMLVLCVAHVQVCVGGGVRDWGREGGREGKRREGEGPCSGRCGGWNGSAWGLRGGEEVWCYAGPSVGR